MEFLTQLFIVAVSLCVVFGCHTPATADGNLKMYALPAGEPQSEDYTLKINGTPVPVHVCRVSAMPFNQVWPGYQRPLEQTELAAFASWDATGPVTVEVTARRPAKSVAIRPTSKGVTPVVAGQRITFQLPGPGQFTVELDGIQRPLQLFYNPPETEIPDRAAPNVRYFGPGVHAVGEITLTNNSTIYIAGGAVVHGFISGQNVSHVRILGRGILDASKVERANTLPGSLRFDRCQDIVIDGVILRDPPAWGLTLFGCRGAKISNVKLVGFWRYNADGIDICNSQDVVVRDSFIRSFDDGIVIKGKKQWSEQPVQNITVERCVIWCDWGRALEIGAETSAPEIADVTFSDCDVIHTSYVALDIQHGDRAAIHDIVFRDIRVEVDDVYQRPRIQTSPADKYVNVPDPQYLPLVLAIVIQKNNYSDDKESGLVRQVAFQNIRVTGKRLPASSFTGLDTGYDVSDVKIENLQFNGSLIEDVKAANLQTNAFVKGLIFIPASGKIHEVEKPE